MSHQTKLNIRTIAEGCKVLFVFLLSYCLPSTLLHRIFLPTAAATPADAITFVRLAGGGRALALTFGAKRILLHLKYKAVDRSFLYHVGDFHGCDLHPGSILKIVAPFRSWNLPGNVVPTSGPQRTHTLMSYKSGARVDTFIVANVPPRTR